MQDRRNNFGLLRLVFASLVIVGHAPEQIDGNRAREPLTVVFHTISLGGLSVSAFFLLSGFLITKSALTSTSVWTYFGNRVRRICPGYLVAFLLCVFALGPFVGGSVTHHAMKTLTSLVLLHEPPTYPGLLSGLPMPALDGSMWTISYEFRCYLLVAILLVSGVLRRRRAVLLVTVAALGATVLMTSTLGAHVDTVIRKFWGIAGTPSESIPLTATFLVGACVFLYWPELKRWVDGRAALVSTLTLAASIFLQPIAQTGVAVFGAVGLFWLGLKADLGPLQRINDRWDISYGTYLYGWPVAITILYFDRSISPWALAALTLPAAMTLGALSWWGVEKPVKDRFGARAELRVAKAA